MTTFIYARKATEKAMPRTVEKREIVTASAPLDPVGDAPDAVLARAPEALFPPVRVEAPEVAVGVARVGETVSN